MEPNRRRLQVIVAGTTVAETIRGFRVLETSHPPVFYFPPQDVREAHVRRSVGKTSFCEWKGQAVYHDLVVGGRVIPSAAWSYPDPVQRYAVLRDHLAFYAEPVDACLVDGEQVQPQPGNFYGGWITSDVTGPFKGVAGSHGW